MLQLLVYVKNLQTVSNTMFVLDERVAYIKLLSTLAYYTYTTS